LTALQYAALRTGVCRSLARDLSHPAAGCGGGVGRRRPFLFPPAGLAQIAVRDMGLDAGSRAARA